MHRSKKSGMILSPLSFFLFLFTFILLINACNRSEQIEKSPANVFNQLTESEIADGWVMLWDGKTFDGWRAIYEQDFPQTGWIIENDALVCLGTELPDSIRGGATSPIKNMPVLN